MTRSNGLSASRIAVSIATLAAGGWMGLAVAPAGAALLASDAFDYPVGDLTGQGSGADPGWAGGWTALSGTARNVTAGSLVSPVASGESGNKATLTGSRARRELDSAIVSGTAYIGVLFQRNANTANSARIELTATTNQSLLFSFAMANSNFGADLGMQIGLDYFPSGASAALGTPYQLVVKVEFDATGVGGTGERLSFFINQATEGAPDAVADARSDGANINFAQGLDAIQLLSNSGTGGGSPQPAQIAHFDELRITTSYAEALVPEPATAGLLLAAAALVTGRPRRYANDRRST